MKWFKNKRDQIAKALPANSVLILDSPPEYFRQWDIKFPYRQESHLYYLTGFTQPASLFLLFPSGKSVMFIADKDPVKEVWDGPLHDLQKVRNHFLIDEVYVLSELNKILPRLLKKKSKLFYDKLNPFFNKKISPLKITSSPARDFLKPFRKVKDSTELTFIKNAVAISIHAHKQVAKALKPGISERTLHGIFIKSIMEKGSAREAYGGIFACGENATILHYTHNDAICKKGELLLVDAGSESNYYSSDITRVYPVSGQFSESQKKLYESLLKLQKNLIKKVRPGISLKHLHQKMCEGIINIALDFHLLKGSFKENFKKKSYKKYCPHFVGHPLGLDVHDNSFLKKEEPILRPGMVVTIEPGFYISKQDPQAKKELKGLGIRIEDDILVTSTGYKNLTKHLPKEISAIEQLCL